MKILVDLQGAQTESRYRGIGRQARALATHLIAAGGAHDVHVLLNGGLTGGLDELRHAFAQLVSPRNIHLFGVPSPVREFDRANLWRMRAAELHREAVIADIGPDILYVTSLFEGVNEDAVTSIGLMAAPYATAATLFDLIPLSDPARYLGADFVRHFYYRRAQSLKRADHLIAISAFAKNEAIELLQIPADQIDVVLLAADPSFRQSVLDDAARADLRRRYGLPHSYIFYVGAIEPRKNIPLIIEAFARLTPEERGNTSLVFGGRLSDVERTQLMIAATRSGVLPDRLILPGYIAEDDLADLYSSSSLFVFPSMQEGFGLPPLEAMACGAPVLVANNSSLPEVVGRDDMMFDTFDADDLARKMARVLNDNAYANELRRWGVERASHFSWAKAGRETLLALERLHARHRATTAAGTMLALRPKLAFVSPLPADRSGIANYASELLRELACYYDVECIIDGSLVDDAWILSNFPLRSVEYLRKHASGYHCILYQLGNSSYHEHMFDLMIEHPGVVVLHDFFLSGIFNWLASTGRTTRDVLAEQLLLTHGLPSLFDLREIGRDDTVLRYPANQIAFTNSLGIVVHSDWAIARAQEIYGDTATEKMVRIPHLRASKPLPDRAAARRRLGIDPGVFVVATFGFVAETKLSDRLCEAWASSATAQAAGSRLIFVGDHPPGPWGETFNARVTELAQSADVHITGYVDQATYELYLTAADVAVQLRQQSRGETSGAQLDCMAAGLPSIVNAHGPAAELPADAVIMLPDVFATGVLTQAIDQLFHDAGLRARMGEAARTAIEQWYHPKKVGEQVRDAIERFSASTAAAHQAVLIKAIGDLHAPVAPNDDDHVRLARAIAQTTRRVGLRKIFYDITLLSQSDAHTGIERVARAILSQLIRRAPDGFMVEAVRFESGNLLHARRYIAEKFDLSADVLPDSPISFAPGDVYLSLEWAADILPQMEEFLTAFRRAGGRVVLGIYDLLPFLIPHRFPDFIPGVAERWFRAALRLVDDFMCISKSVADDVLKFGCALGGAQQTPIRVNYFHLSADIEGSVPTTGIPTSAPVLLDRLQSAPTFLMVGTIEPRKGHQQVLEAFRLLWEEGRDANLVIVGRQGWLVEDVVRTIETSREAGQRLEWIRNASDEYLTSLYGAATALIAASEGEGFGLPLIEGAQHGLGLIARDIPVFREVAGEHAFYFDGKSGTELADVLRTWLENHERGMVQRPAPLATATWMETLETFWARLCADEPYGWIMPAVRTSGGASARQ